MVTITLYAKQKKRHRCIEQSLDSVGEVGWVGCFKRTASKHVYYLGWNRSPAQVGCMRQVLRPGALGRPRGIGWRGRWEGGLGWGTHVNPWLTHVNVWQKPLQYCKVISLQLIKKKKKVKLKKKKVVSCLTFAFPTRMYTLLREGPYLSYLMLQHNILRHNRCSVNICWKNE